VLSGCAARGLAQLFLVGGRPHPVENIPYGKAARQRLDVYPLHRNGQPAPVVIFLYGGRWQRGSRRQYRPLGYALNRRGFVAVIPDYRLYPEVRFPGWVEDAASAVRWVSRNIREYGGDPSRIFVVGHSAGAHTAVLLALDRHYLGDAGLAPAAVEAFVSLAGPVATTWTDPDVQALMGPRERWPATYPMKQVDRPTSPLLLMHGGRDRTVAVENSIRLAARIRQHGGCAQIITYRGLGHVGLILALALPRLDIAPVLDDVVQFLHRPLRACGGTGPANNQKPR
jgi:acetyl esterase/lipase